MPRGRGRGRGRKAKIPTPEPPGNPDDEIAEAIRQSQEDYEKAEILKKKEEEELQKAINESLKSHQSAPKPNDDSFRLQLEDTSENSSTPNLENSGLLTTLQAANALVGDTDLNGLQTLVDSAPVVGAEETVAENPLDLPPSTSSNDHDYVIHPPTQMAEIITSPNPQPETENIQKTSTPIRGSNPAVFAKPTPKSNQRRVTRNSVRGRSKRGRGATRATPAPRIIRKAAEKVIIPSSSFQVDEEEPLKPKKNEEKPLKNGKKVEYESDDSNEDYGDPNFESSVLDESSILEDMKSFVDPKDITLHTIGRDFAPESRFSEVFEEIDEHFNDLMRGRAEVESIVTAKNENLEIKYNQKKESFQILNIPTTELTLYYNSYSGNSQSVLWNIVKRHFKPLRNHDGRTDYGKGVYLYTYPNLIRAQDQGVVVCRVLIGNSHRIKKPEKTAIPKGHHSKHVDLKTNSFYVINNIEQILPIAVIHCGVNAPQLNAGASRMPVYDPEAEREKVNRQMAKLFENSLKLHLTGQYMMPCRAIQTSLYPHQMYALAWMANRENLKSRNDVKGGILADDMGLGKTLTVMSLILTNFHDKRPLAAPLFGYKRQFSNDTMKYMPMASHKSNGSEPLGSRNFRRKDAKGKVKGSKRKYAEETYFITSEKKPSPMDDSDFLANFQDEDEKDEFDSLIEDKASYKERLGLDSASDFFDKKAKRPKFFDDLSDDEEYQNMSEAERNEKMAPKLNLDGAITDSSDDEEIISKRNKKITKKFTVSSDDEESSNLRENNDSDDLDIPDFDMAEEVPETKEEPKSQEYLDKLLTEDQKKNLIKPLFQAAKAGDRRRATLIVTPASLIGHWLEQIERHVDKSVDLSVFVHHGINKSMLATELQGHDIVLTTYGTLQSEFNEAGSCGPLLKAKWLRVCLDEGHFIKNHLSKTAKAALRLDTERKWIISGTPIQNNLTELWCLLVWLNEPNYGGNRIKYRREIEGPVKMGSMRGVLRLQFLIEAFCLRRTKKDEVGGKPLVVLPPKNVQIKELEFTREEKIVYEAYEKECRKVVERFMKKNTALKNYAHIFAIMMRLRQLCCHREMLTEISWKNIKLEEIEEMISEVHQADAEENEEDEERSRALAERLREMIRDGISDECSICLGDFDHPVITPCAHIYCKPCITQLIETFPQPPAPCPLCRGPLELRGLLEAAKNENEDDEEDANAFEDVKVDVSSSKINAALTHLNTIRAKNPDDKVIIVSQFTKLLSIFQPLLDDEGYKWTRLDGTMSTRQRSEIIANFQDVSPDAPKVLLLSLRAGGVGLNLNVANHMILLDPAWNPSTEEQCFDRIHRLGQTKDVEIVRFVMKNSIEMKMLDIQERKKNLISGAFRQTEAERRQQRLQDIRDLFNIQTND